MIGKPVIYFSRTFYILVFCLKHDVYKKIKYYHIIVFVL